MHILYIFTVGHFFSPNNKKWFKLFYNHNDIEVSALLEEPQDEIKEEFSSRYGQFYNIVYFQNKQKFLKKNFFKRFFYLKSVARKIDALDPDVIHIQGIYFSYMVLPLLFIKTKPKIIVNIWGSDFNIMYFQFLKNRIIINWLIRKCHLVWCNWFVMSDSIKEKFSKYIKKIYTIPVGVSRDIFIPAKEENRDYIRKKFNIQKDEFLIIYTRGFKMNSNYHKIINALGHINTNYPYKVIFHIFRNDPIMDNYFNKLITANNLEDKIIISHCDLADEEIKALYEIADLTFSASEKDQFSRTIHLAILTNTNIILNDIEPYRYLKYAFNWDVDLVDVNNVAELSRRIEYYITHKPRAEWNSEKMFIKKMFDFESKGDLYKAIYQELINKK